MKINIGPYKYWFGPYQLCALLKYVGVSESGRDNIAEKISAKPFEWFDKKFKKRKIIIRIDDYDTWSADHTLSLIIHPLLVKLKNNKDGAPYIDDEDAPENLRSTNAKPKENEWDTDEFHFDRWDYVLDEMIFAFEKSIDNSWEEEFYSGKSDPQSKCINEDETDPEKRLYEAFSGPNDTFKVDRDGIKKIQIRMQNGYRLFGKYYSHLWT
jgi:hypothetical protein